jgi:Cd2+/Zn2+-exporting ATPase
VVALDGLDESRVLGLASALEGRSTHPVAQAVVRAAIAGAGAGVLPASDVTEIPGRGIRGRVDGGEYAVGSVVLAEEMGALDGPARERIAALESRGKTALVLLELASAARVLGVLGVADEVRQSSRDVVTRLRAGGVRSIVLLTGDNERTAAAVAEHVGVTDVRSRLLPDDKGGVVAELKRDHGAVAMVGDGINDAPALARADIGIAMGAAGSDTALETADVALMTEDLAALPRFFELGRRTVANIRQNVAISVAVKLAVLVAAVAGFAQLWLAVFADTGVALLVILNGLRLLRPAAKP